MTEPFNLGAIADGLVRGPDGIWIAREQAAVSYPEGGNANCLGLEEDSFWFAHRSRCIEAAVRRFPPPGALLDVGGGNGYVAAGLIRAGFATTLLEPGWDGVQNARRRGVEPLVCATLESARFHPGSLPAVGLFDVLEHIAGDAGFLKTVSDLLVPGGRVYLTVPAYGWLWSADDAYAGHARRYTRGLLARRLASAGLRVAYATYLFVPFPLPLLLLRALPTRLGLRKAAAWDSYRSEHANRSGLVGGLLARWLAWELAQVQRGRALPFGGSVLVVAQKDFSAVWV